MISISGMLLCATAAGLPCHVGAIHVDTEPRAGLPIDSAAPAMPVDTPITRRPKAIQYSDWYARRLLVHRIGSYTMIPLFAAEWSLGQNLLQDQDPPSWMRGTHQGVAVAIGALFTVNTVTGLWNLWDSRQDPAGRTRRYLHTAAMLASDAGFIWAGAVGGDARRSRDNANHHRAIALTSIGVSTAGTVMMWLWKQ
jgi:hypothetical protein